MSDTSSNKSDYKSDNKSDKSDKEIPEPIDDKKDADEEHRGNGAVYAKSMDAESDEKEPLKEPIGATGTDDVRINVADEGKPEFRCLTKEELQKYVKSKKWRWIRIGMFIAFWVIWVAILVAAVVVVVTTPKCPKKPEQMWWESTNVYQILPQSFKDSNADGKGDIQGIISKLSYMEEELEVKTIYLNGLINKTNNEAVRTDIGTMDDLNSLVLKLEQKAMKLITDYELSSGAMPEENLNYWLDRGIDGFVVKSSDLAKITGSNSTIAAMDMLKIMQETEKGWGNQRLLVVDPENQERSAFSGLKGLVLNGLLATDPIGTCKTAITADCVKEILESGPSKKAAWQFTKLQSTRVKNRIDDELSYLPSLMAVMARGTPFIYYGEELGMSGAIDTPMLWTSGKNAGFSSTEEDLDQIPDTYRLQNLAARKASGAQSSVFTMLKDLLKLRKEPSLLWGKMKTYAAENKFLMTRKADGFPGYVLIVNLGEYDVHTSISDIADTSESGEVVAVTPNLHHQHFKIGGSVQLNNIVVPAKTGFVCKFE